MTNKPPATRVFYSTTETALILGISKKTLYALLRSNRLPHIRTGRVIRINVEDLKALSFTYAQPTNEAGDDE